MNKTIKLLSVILAAIMFAGCFSAANPVFAAEVQELSTEAVSEAEAENEKIESEEVENEEASESQTEKLSSLIQDEIVELRTENVKYFQQSDGTILAAQYSVPVHYEKNGEWLEIDNSLNEKTVSEDSGLFSAFTADEKEFTAENRENPITFPDKFATDASKRVSVGIGGTQISFAPKGQQSGLKKASGSIEEIDELQTTVAEKAASSGVVAGTAEKLSSEKITAEKPELNSKLKAGKTAGAVAYDDVFPSVSLEYKVRADSIKESIVLEKKQSKNSFEFVMDLGALFPKTEADGSITLFANSALTEPIASIRAPYMIDSAGAYSDAVTMAIAPQGEEYVLTVTASSQWLNDNNRVYPVIIDPTIDLNITRSNMIDCYVDTSDSDGAFPYDTSLYAGYSSLGKTRTYVKFPLPDLPDSSSIITGAFIAFYQWEIDMNAGTENYLTLHKVQSNWNNESRTVTWDNQPSFSSSVALDYCQFEYGSAEYCFDITRLVKEWYNSVTPNYGVVLKADDETVVSRARICSAEDYDV